MGTVVNVVGSGDLDARPNLEVLVEAAQDRYHRCDLLSPTRLKLQFGKRSPVITLHDDGSFKIRNLTDPDQLSEISDRLFRFVAGLNDEHYGDNATPATAINVVYVGDLNEEIDHSDRLDLEELNDFLGDHAVHPDRPQASLVYRMPAESNVVFIAPTGRVVVSGPQSVAGAERVYSELTAEITRFLEPDSR